MNTTDFEPAVVIQNLTKTYGDVVAINDLNLKIRKGEFITLLGPSGSGKTTTLMALAGFVIPDHGQIFISGKDISYQPPHKRGLGMVFQDYALFPHMTVFENVAFSLKMRKYENAEVRKKVKSALELVQLAGFEDRYPKQLSGGQCQRIALARAIVFEPSVLLLDEPLGALDRKLREHMQLELRHIHQKLGVTFISVTHDQDEALTMSDRILVMDKGAIVQLGTPEELYEEPSCVFVADFLGKSNLLKASIEKSENEQTVIRLRSGHQIIAGRFDGPSDQRDVTLQIRPEKIFFANSQDKLGNIIEGSIMETVYLGEMARYIVNLGNNQQITISKQNLGSEKKHRVNDKIRFGWKIEDSKIF